MTLGTTTPLPRPRQVFLALLCLLALLVFIPPRAAQASSPRGTVERLNALFTDAGTQATPVDTTQRLAQLTPDLRDIFDFWLMAKAAAGSVWPRLGRTRQDALVEAFAEFTIATYAARFNALHGANFEVVGIEQGRHDTFLVRTEGRRGNGEKIHQAYLTRAFEGRWLVVDVLLDGKFSQLAATRAEVLAVIRNQGFKSLLRLLRQKTQELRGS